MVYLNFLEKDLVEGGMMMTRCVQLWQFSSRARITKCGYGPQSTTISYVDCMIW